MPVYGGIVGGVAAGVSAHDEHTTTSYLVAAAGDRVTNTTDQTTHATSHTFNPGDLAVGDRIDITALFNIPTANSTDTLTVFGYLGGTLILGTNATDPLNSGQGLSWDASLFVTAIGASGEVHVVGGRGMTYYTTIGSPMVGVAVDMSTAFDLEFKSQWSVANASNIVDLRALYVTINRFG